MGFAICRFNKDKGCSETGSQEYHINLQDLNIHLNVPSMWKHYMTEHLIQPTQREREVVMKADPSQAIGNFMTTRSAVEPEHVKVLYVERIDQNQYSHQVGTQPDTQFIHKLETIIKNIEPAQTKGFDSGQRNYSDFKPGEANLDRFCHQKDLFH